MTADSFAQGIKERCKKTKTNDFKGHNKKINSVGWNCTGEKLASGSLDTTLRIWDINHGKGDTKNGHEGSIESLCWNPLNSNQVATASTDKTVKIWDPRSSKPVASIKTAGENINISWSPNGNAVAVGNRDDQIGFIDTRKWNIFMRRKFAITVNEIKWNNAGDKFFLTNGRGCICVCDYPKITVLHQVVGHTSECICIDFDKTGRYFATGSVDALLCIWDAEELIPLRTITRSELPVRSTSFSYDGQLIALGTENPMLEISSVESGEFIHKIEAPGQLYSVAWSPNKYHIAYAGDTSLSREDRGALRVSVF